MLASKEGNYREMPPVNKVKIAKLAQMWRLLPPNLEFWQFFAMASWLVYILGQRQKFDAKSCQNEGDLNQFVHIFEGKFKFVALKKP